MDLSNIKGVSVCCDAIAVCYFVDSHRRIARFTCSKCRCGCQLTPESIEGVKCQIDDEGIMNSNGESKQNSEQKTTQRRRSRVRAPRSQGSKESKATAA